MTTYQFALLRYVHDIGAGEFVNVGVVLYLPDAPRLQWQLTRRLGRAKRFFKGLSIDRLRNQLRMAKHALTRKAREFNGERPLPFTGEADITSILKAVFSDEPGSLTWSHGFMAGVTEDATRRLDELFNEFVGRFEEGEGRPRRDEKAVRDSIDRVFREKKVFEVAEMKQDVPVAAPHYRHTFPYAWQNGQLQVLEPISFDLVAPEKIVEKAATWSGRLYNLAKAGTPFQMTGVVAPPQEGGLEGAYEDALAILREAPNIRQVVPESELDTVIRSILRDTEGH